MVWWIPLAIAAVSAMQKQQQTAEMHKANALKSQELSQGYDKESAIAKALMAQQANQWQGGMPANQSKPSEDDPYRGFYG
jgi:hypothetical protein